MEISLASLKRVFGISQTLATTLVGLATRIMAKIAAYTYAFLVNRKGGSRIWGLKTRNTHLEAAPIGE